jgi:small subunit ribosomal protein SAe
MILAIPGCINQRFTPGLFTNHSIKGKFVEPRLIVVCDPNTDTQAIREASYASIPCIGLCDSDANLSYVDCVIPCNTKNKQGIGVVLWLLTREVLRLRGTLHRADTWRVLPDLFFYRAAEDESRIKEEMEGDGRPGAAAETGAAAAVPVAAIPADGPRGGAAGDWNQAGDAWGV